MTDARACQLHFAACACTRTTPCADIRTRARARARSSARAPKVAERVADGDAGVRQALRVLLSEHAFNKLPPGAIRPFMPVLMAHVSSAMTNLNMNVRKNAPPGNTRLPAVLPRQPYNSTILALANTKPQSLDPKRAWSPLNSATDLPLDPSNARAARRCASTLSTSSPR
jgi:hypothetical protein